MFLTTNIAAAYAPLSIAIVCRQTTTFWASLVAYLALGENLYPLEIVGMVLCFAAVIVIAMQQRNEEDDPDVEKNPYDRQNIGIYLNLAGAVVLAAQTVSFRALKTVRPEVSIFYNNMFGFSASALYLFGEMIITGNQTRLASYTGRQYGFCLASATFDIGVMIGNTIAYAKDRQGFVALVSYMSLVYCFLCDTFILHEELNVVELCCAVWILCVALGIAIFKLRKARQAQAEAEVKKVE